ncbi:hypothetical protein AB833_12330 [Chromatiales bacterium (ex Bugula neritina AB1)]|nr:hypothetical protein AB833_12330 [Chromatiales bacterium (ex Bugula neritina AB1)]
MSDQSDKELLDALGVETKGKKKSALSAREERIIAGFEDIQRFVDENNCLPQPGEDNDIFERLYAIRLQQIQKLPESKELLSALDHQGILGDFSSEGNAEQELDDEELLAQLGADQKCDLTNLKHVRPRAEITAAEEIASRIPCENFDEFKTLFGTINFELKSGALETKRFEEKADIRKGDMFILSGQIAFVDQVGEEFITEYERKNSRLRVIYDNGTESDILLRSLQVALNKDPSGRRIISKDHGPLFSDETYEDDYHSGIIYVLRSKSELPEIKQHQKLLHKIGVTRDSVEKRIANAKNESTYLMADVEIVASRQLYNINSTKLEALIHKFFDSARLDVAITGVDGKPVSPREWFLVPLFVIEDFFDKLQDGSIQKYVYDTESASLVKTNR